MNETKPIYLGEAQLIRWGHNGTSGKTVTIELPADLLRHPFDGLPIGKESGQRMQVVFVAMDDHEQPLSVDQAIANAARLKGKKRNGPAYTQRPGASAEQLHADTGQAQDKPRTPFDKLPRSQQAALRCCDEEFQVWIAGKYPDIWDSHYIDGHMLSNGAANATLKDVLKIASKTELDISDAKADAFDRLMTDYSVRGMVR